MSLIVSDFGLLTLAFLVIGYFASAQLFTLGAMSLPCMLMMTSFIYFFLMPVLSFPDGRAEFLGLYIYSLEWPHLAVGLYTAGAVAACYALRRRLIGDPASARPMDRAFRQPVYLILVAVAVAATLTQIGLGKLNFLGDENYAFSEDFGELAFINLFFTMMVPLALVYVVRDGFGLRSLAVLALVCFVLQLTGFRYRLILLAFTVTACFVLVRRVPVWTPLVLVATLVGLLGSNAFGNFRKYGGGFTLTSFQELSWVEILQTFGGEVGGLFPFANVADRPIQEHVFVLPWVIAVLRFIPSFIWSNKPTPDYLYIPHEGFPMDAKAAGVAFPQHVEILLQFGWIGLPAVAFLYFWIAVVVLDRLSRLGREARIVGFALVPVFFGFYMPTRGYFFQALADGVFTFGPLFLLYGRGARPVLPMQRSMPFASRPKPGAKSSR